MGSISKLPSFDEAMFTKKSFCYASSITYGLLYNDTEPVGLSDFFSPEFDRLVFKNKETENKWI